MTTLEGFFFFFSNKWVLSTHLPSSVQGAGGSRISTGGPCPEGARQSENLWYQPQGINTHPLQSHFAEEHGNGADKNFLLSLWDFEKKFTNWKVHFISQ